MIKCTFLDLTLLVCADCFLPIRRSADDDLRKKLLAVSDFCRCKSRRTAEAQAERDCLKEQLQEQAQERRNHE
jgi:hypothetical protein